MTPEQRGGLLALGVAAVAAWLLSPLSPLRGAHVPADSPGDVVWRQGYPRGHDHLCPPGEIDGPLDRHVMYGRPHRVGHNRQLVIDNGWEWVANPPSEQGPGMPT
jgi:hypothetical protein